MFLLGIVHTFYWISGDFCNEDFDGCADEPCTEGTMCTDAFPVAHAQTGKAFECSPCPSGYEPDYGICVGEMLNEMSSVWA